MFWINVSIIAIREMNKTQLYELRIFSRLAKDWAVEFKRLIGVSVALCTPTHNSFHLELNESGTLPH